MNTTVKTCFKCNVKKPITDFYVHPQMGDGRLGKCKECTKRDVAQNYRDNRAYYAMYERERYQTPERKKYAQAQTYKARLNNPQKAFARVAVHNAVRDGKLTRLPCQVCGREKTEAHHEDYSKPLDVMWLCRPHHKERHGMMTYEGLIPPKTAGAAA